MFGSAIFYPAMPENEEDNKIRLSLDDQYDVRFDPEPREARLTHLFHIDKGETHVSFS